MSRKRVAVALAALALIMVGVGVGHALTPAPTADQLCTQNGHVNGTAAYTRCMGEILGVRG